MADVVSFAQVTDLFRAFEHTAWRLETRRGYASDRKSPKWARWLNGEAVETDPDSAWLRNVREQTREGKRFERVRLVDDPPTDGQLFLLASGQGNVQAGEDIRNMYRADAERLRLPDFDFWLFDSRVVVKFHFDADDVTLGVEVIDEPAQVLAACQARDAAWHHAVRTAEFQRRVRSTV
ncbi:hypothetical protein QCN29_24110 [Streptomyces sp. HNM0663]|uniref:DUF6879 domain-containing protein n=1 Tax=Streptomyces chengmaiensis TaxID=3040919 RepID=A0ABT6HTA4_9ACTN|nr:DUF6879 family protein [Streptomyces chengmaiensis]MDH2391805.1 hypothetical protein [Streptomyces chengmaiensis]